MATIKVAKTIRQPIEMRPSFDVWYAETKTLYNQVVSFYFDVYQSELFLLDMGAKDALTAIEKLTHRTVQNPNPLIPLDVAIVADIPSMFRRAAINQARGSFQSFSSNMERWRKDKEAFESKPTKKGKKRVYGNRPPVPPRQFNFNPSLYDGMHKDRTTDSIMVKLWSGYAWQWVKIVLKGDCPNDWDTGSPIIVHRRGHFFLHTPVSKKIENPGKLSLQVKEQRLQRICSVDLNLDGTAAVCVILNNDGTPIATKFIHRSPGLDDCRKRLLGQIAIKRSKTGIIATDEQDNARLWQRIRDLDENEAHRISRRIVDFAETNRANVLVFEHLKNLTPVKGKYSTRSNAKRAYWLKGKIVDFSQYKAWHVGIITSRVSPKDTSRLCPCCKQPIARYSNGQSPIDYNPGSPLYLCNHCLSRGNADRAASINVGHKFLDRYYPGQYCLNREKPQSMDVNFYA